MRALLGFLGIIMVWAVAFIYLAILFAFVTKAQANDLHIGSITIKDAPGPIRIAVIDTGLDLKDVRFKGHLCASGHRDFTGEGLRDQIGHGTHVSGLIQQYGGPSSRYCLVIVKYFSYHQDSATQTTHEIEALNYASKLGVDIIHFSGGGTGSNRTEREIIASMKSLFVVAAGNNSADLDSEGMEFYPASYKLPNMVVVGSNGHTSNHGSAVTDVDLGENIYSELPNGEYGYLSGTSMAAAIHTGRIVHHLVTGDNN